MAALLTRASIGPLFASTVRTASRTWSSSATSARQASAEPPARSIAAAVSSSSDCVRPIAATAQPSLANASPQSPGRVPFQPPLSRRRAVRSSGTLLRHGHHLAPDPDRGRSLSARREERGSLGGPTSQRQDKIGSTPLTPTLSRGERGRISPGSLRLRNSLAPRRGERGSARGLPSPHFSAGRGRRPLLSRSERPVG